MAQRYFMQCLYDETSDYLGVYDVTMTLEKCNYITIITSFL